MDRPLRIVFATDWSGPAPEIWNISAFGYSVWSPDIYRLWEPDWLAEFRRFRELHPEVLVLPRLHLDTVFQGWVGESSVHEFYWTHRRWVERAIGDGLATDTGTPGPAAYDWTKRQLPELLALYLCAVAGPLRDRRLVDGVTLIGAPKPTERPPGRLKRILGGKPTVSDPAHKVVSMLRDRMGVDCLVGTREDVAAPWDSQAALEAATAWAVVEGRWVLDDGLHDLRVLWPKALNPCRPLLAQPLSFGGHTTRFLGGAVAVVKDGTQTGRIYWPDPRGDVMWQGGGG